jgi:hypothetical protein
VGVHKRCAIKGNHADSDLDRRDFYTPVMESTAPLLPLYP